MALAREQQRIPKEVITAVGLVQLDRAPEAGHRDRLVAQGVIHSRRANAEELVAAMARAQRPLDVDVLEEVALVHAADRGQDFEARKRARGDEEIAGDRL